MTPLLEPEISFAGNGPATLDDAMVVMGEAFDPEFGEAWSRKQCTGILTQPGVWISVISEDTEPAGFALARTIADEAELLLIGVRPRYRNRGFGTQLLNRVCAEAAAHGAVKIHLEMREGNRAERLYRAHGFEPVGRRRRYYRGRSGQRFDAITWSLAIKAKATE